MVLLRTQEKATPSQLIPTSYFVYSLMKTRGLHPTMLEEWAANRIFGNTLPKQGQIKPETVASYLSALKSYHIDWRLSLKGFDDRRMTLIIKGRKRLFPSKKRNRLAITKDILEKITKNKPLTIEDLNVDKAFKVAWVGFVRMRELTYSASELKKETFKDTKLTRSDISFAEGDQYAILRLKRSKTDVEHTGFKLFSSNRRINLSGLNLTKALYTRSSPIQRSPFQAFDIGLFSPKHTINFEKTNCQSWIDRSGLLRPQF